MYPQNCVRRAWCRKTGCKMDYPIGEFSSTGNENGIRHFECIFSCSLPSTSVPSIAFDQQHKPFPFWFFDSLAMKLRQGVKNEQTKNSQC